MMILLALVILGVLIIIASVLSSLLSLYFEIKYWRGRRRAGELINGNYPWVTVIMPVRGLDQNIKGNIASVLDQDYPGRRNYIFVLDSDDDPAYGIIKDLIKGFNVDASVLINRGGRSKGEALAFALSHVDGEIVVFVDSDALVHRHWLRNLVSSLVKGSGAATTYRFYVPLRRLSLGSLLRASFNMIGITAMQNPVARFTWGGSTAIWKWILDKWRIRDYLPYYLSDDYVITHFVHREGLAIDFVPESLVLTLEDVSIKEAFTWSVRQLWYVRVYGFRGFLLYAASYTLYVVTLPIAIALSFINAWFIVPGLLPFIFGVVKDYIRISGIKALDRFYGINITRGYSTLLALISILNVYFSWLAIIKTMFTKSINWRGREFTVMDAIRLMKERPLE
ncbi:glycosyltransferase [Vulcanisaeta distributa]|uniref:Glycosyl transferase family 2 n=1 Tax=Vulcanisaeta distributa (strain DSM 14429 / JCM 11212 / NBRC 100878 / IC-017) TaxID=572478 RepID=E1QS89_VULDI|nr:glycosyltransferase family 2 protein [Vulcanisaeta distributa]ADN49482.1 glycosyl transferase family 2 [Vulcanisaeta distributa DSM 14429]